MYCLGNYVTHSNGGREYLAVTMSDVDDPRTIQTQSPPPASCCVMTCVILFGNKIRIACTCMYFVEIDDLSHLFWKQKKIKSWRKLLKEIYMDFQCIYVCCVIRLGTLNIYIVSLRPLEIGYKLMLGVHLRWTAVPSGGVNDSSD